jgi:hypothetical protein
LALGELPGILLRRRVLGNLDGDIVRAGKLPFENAVPSGVLFRPLPALRFADYDISAGIAPQDALSFNRPCGTRGLSVCVVATSANTYSALIRIIFSLLTVFFAGVLY